MNRRLARLLVGLGAAAAMLGVAVALPRLAAAGWLIGFVFVGAVPFGSLGLMLIHRLTGGQWGEALRPVLEPAALCIPALAILFVPVLIALPVLFPWAGGAEVKPDVAAFYLNNWAFIARSVIALVGWSVLALALPRTGGGAGTLLAAVGLVFHSVATNLIAIDWILSTEPVFISTSFGASVVIVQLLAALAFAAFAAPRSLDAQAVRDLGGLMLAVILGLTYIDFMAVLVIWYSDLPHKVEFLVRRTRDAWKWVAIFFFVLGAVIPILSLLLSRVRASLPALRLIALSSLAGIALYSAWLLAPVYGAWALATGALAALTLGCALVAFADAARHSALFNRLRPAHE
jgi:hypothetical protein